MISSNFGTQYFVTSTPSKNAYNCVRGFTFLLTNWIFLDLIKEIRSLLKVLSPWEVRSNCSVIATLTPVLFFTPVSITSRNVSSIVLVVVLSTQAAGLVSPPLGQPPLPNVTEEDSVFLCAEFTISCPVQLSTQEFQTVGTNPVWGSAPRSLIVDL